MKGAYRDFALCKSNSFSILLTFALRSSHVSFKAESTFEFDPLWLLCLQIVHRDVRKHQPAPPRLRFHTQTSHTSLSKPNL